MPAKLQKGIDLFTIKELDYLIANYSIKATKLWGIDVNVLAMDIGHSFRTWSNKGKVKCPKNIPKEWQRKELWELEGVCKKDLIEIALWRKANWKPTS